MLNVNSYVCTLAQMNVLIYYFSGKSFVFYFSYSVAGQLYNQWIQN